MIKGLLFDKDGTLIDNAGPWVYALANMIRTISNDDETLCATICADIGLDLHSHRAVPFSPLAQGTFEETSGRIQSYVPHLTQQDIFHHMAQIANNAERHVAPLIGTIETIRTLHAQGYALGIFSNDSADGIQHAVNDMQLGECFCFTAGADSGFGAKPAAGYIHAFADHCALTPAEIAVIGDSPADMLSADYSDAALKVGIHPNGDDPVLRHYTPHILTNLTPLPDLLSGL